MSWLLRSLVKLASVLMAFGLLFAADVAFSLAGLHRILEFVSIVLVVFSALSLLPLVQARLRRGKWADYKIAGFVAAISALLLFSMNGIRQMREAQGISALFNDSGNCTTLFSPLMRTGWVQHWISGKRPVLRYAQTVLQDSCKMAEIHEEFSSARPPACPSEEAYHPDRCYREVLEGLMARDPLTMPGVGLALSEGMVVAMRDRGPRADSAGAEKRIVEQYRLAASTLGLVAAVLDASQKHLTPGTLLGEPIQAAKEGAPEWEMMKILYRRNWISDEDEAHLLTQADRKLEETLDRELLASAKKINSKLEKPKDSGVAVAIAPYQDQISHFNQRIHDFEENDI